jgi:hypothetical protein
MSSSQEANIYGTSDESNKLLNTLTNFPLEAAHVLSPGGVSVQQSFGRGRSNIIFR